MQVEQRRENRKQSRDPTSKQKKAEGRIIIKERIPVS